MLSTELLLKWRRAIAITDHLTTTLERAMQANEAGGTPYTELKEVALIYDQAQQDERLAARAYLACLDAEAANRKRG